MKNRRILILNLAIMKSAVYIETFVLSYLTDRPSNDLRVAAYQNITADWWV